MNNLNGNRKNEFRRKQEEKQRKLALKIEDEAGELREGSLKSEEAIPSLDELCAIGERVEQLTTFSAKEAMRNKIKARRDAERYKATSTDSEKWTPNPFEDSNAAAIESPKNEDTINTTRKHADAQSTKSAGLKTSKRRSIVEMVQKLKKYVPIVVCGDVLYYYNGYYYEAIGLEKLIKLYRKYVDYDLNNEPSLYAYKDLYQCCTTDPELERSEPENQSIHAPLENGVYDLMKKELKPHDPRRLIFTYIKASYDESAECPVFNSFLKQITHGNPQLEERFWMAIGYLMIYPARGKFFIVMGYARDSGKSVLGNFIQRLYPKESVGNLRLQEMKGTFSSMSFLNAVINLELDMPNAKLNAEVASRLKQITGGDSITVQRKYLSPVTLTRRIKFVFAGNYPLCIDGEDDALQKRIVFLPFKLDLMAAKVFEHLTFDKGKTVKEVYKILNRCMAEEKTVRISRKAMLENSIARQRERLDKYIDLCADGIITKQELAERRKGLDAQIAELQSQYENVEQEDERSGTLDMNLIAQKLDGWQKASRNDVNRELINSCVAQITPLTNEEYRWVLDFQLTEVQSRNSATCTLDGFMEMARFRISFEEAKAFKASRNQGIRKNEWHDLTVAVGIRTKT